MSEITNQPLYLIKFDDTEVPDETMFGADVANKRFEQISGNWNAHLFVKVASNSHDDSCSGSNAKLASDYDALAAQRDEGLAREAELRRTVQALRGGNARANIYFSIAESLLREPGYERTPGDFEYEHPIHDQIIALQQRLAEAERLLRGTHTGDLFGPDDWEMVSQFLASPGCADGEKS